MDSLPSGYLPTVPNNASLGRTQSITKMTDSKGKREVLPQSSQMHRGRNDLGLFSPFSICQATSAAKQPVLPCSLPSLRLRIAAGCRVPGVVPGRALLTSCQQKPLLHVGQGRTETWDKEQRLKPARMTQTTPEKHRKNTEKAT